jgi:hypothetical protein
LIWLRRLRRIIAGIDNSSQKINRQVAKVAKLGNGRGLGKIRQQALDHFISLGALGALAVNPVQN